MSDPCLLYVDNGRERGYLGKDGALRKSNDVESHAMLMQFKSIEDAHAEIVRRGWVKSSSACEGGPPHAYACWDWLAPAVPP